MQQGGKLQIVEDDPYLKPYEDYFYRLQHMVGQQLLSFSSEGGLDELSKSYRRYGLHKDGAEFVYREWAPEAKSICLFGQFNQWKRGSLFCQKNGFGQWECRFKADIPIFSRVKCEVVIASGETVDRIPAWINFTVQNEDKSFDGAYVPLGDFAFAHPKPSWGNRSIRIYEAHVGMSGIEERVHSFSEFTTQVLPRVVDLGYNVIQLMGILEHPYYGSFGYHVSNFFSPSSRFGQPNDLKLLIDTAHRCGLKVVIDLVHSHACKNVQEGLNMWDGTDFQYFHAGDKGQHPLWDSKVFDYSKYEVLRFLLSNIRFWLQEYNCDGFRFDGVTSMLYKHHGQNFSFSGDYREYFNDQLDMEALTYLKLVTQLAIQIYPEVILIAEDVSGLPGLCRPAEDGGIGFNFRLAMAVPDNWIKMVKETRDEDWDIEAMAHLLTNRRWKEGCIGYCESHDQALVGDKTLAMWLFGAEIYTHMSVFVPQTPSVFRGMALHKMIRLITFSLAGDGYLNFMGNELGHPEWIDFPREGNSWSYHYCRRRWDLGDNVDLRYNKLLRFDRAMLSLDRKGLLASDYQYIRTKHNADKLIVYEKGTLMFVFNWHCTNSYENYLVYTRKSTRAEVVFSTDDQPFGGHSRVHHQSYQLTSVDSFCSKFELYIPSRCAIVFSLVSQM